MKTLTLQAPIELRAELPSDDEDAAPKLAKVSLLAYSGAPIRQSWSRTPIIIDLDGVQLPSQSIPVPFQHDMGSLFGHTTEITITDAGITASAINSMPGPQSDSAIAAAKNGFPWQASVGMSIDETKELKAGAKARVNGRTVTGPMLIATKTQLDEISIVSLGADRSTRAAIAAKKGNIMDDVSNVAANQDGQDHPAPTPGSLGTPGTPGSLGLSVSASGSDVEGVIAKHEREQERIRRIAAHADRIMEAHPAHTAIIGELARTAKAAGDSAEKFEGDVYRAVSRLPQVHIRNDDAKLSARVVEASIARAAKMGNLEKHYDETTLQKSEDIHRNGLQMMQLLRLAAKSNGYIHMGDADFGEDLLNAAFQRPDQRITAALPNSYINIGGILSNVANKFMRDAFNAVESGWRAVSAIRNVRNFHAISSYSLVGAGSYDLVRHSGEIKSGVLSEVPYSNQAETYGLLLRIDRKDIVNDDLDALSRVPQKLGRSGALKFNQVFWAAFQADHATFFPVDKSRGNYVDGTASVVGIDGLTLANTAFLNQTDPEGHPLGLSARTLLVPNNLHPVANQLLGTLPLITGQDATMGSLNPYAGMFDVVRSSYLTSDKVWYLVADPRDLPVIEAAFLNGREEPTVERANADFNTLGIQMRGYFDFGVAKQEYRAAVKSKGES